MILPSMSFKEMFDGLEADKQKVLIRIDKIYPKVVKTFRKSRLFPTWYIDEYQIPSTNNRYVVFYYASCLNESDKPHYETFCILFNERQRFVIKGMRMGYKHTPDSKMIMLPQIHVFTSHFFQRYNERFLHKEEISTNEIAGFFFVRNKEFTPIKLNENINKNYLKHGQHNILGFIFRDGFGFSQGGIEHKDNIVDKSEDSIEAMGIIHTTFMYKADLTNSQREAIGKEYSNILTEFLRPK